MPETCLAQIVHHNIPAQAKYSATLQASHLPDKGIAYVVCRMQAQKKPRASERRGFDFTAVCRYALN